MAEWYPRLGYTPPGGPRLALNDDDVQLVDVKGAGIPALSHQVARTPNRDGEVYLGRTIVQPRFLIAQLEIAGNGYAATNALRRAAIDSINPKAGMGVIDLTWVPGGVTYEIDALLETGLGFDTAGPDWREFVEHATVSFRCPDPTWREQTLNQIAIGSAGGGLSIPLAMPFTLASAGATTEIVNTGHIDTYPVLVATGEFESLKVTNETTARMVWFAGLAVTEGQTLTVDMKTWSAKVDGVNVMPSLTTDSHMWPLVRGANTVTVEVSSGNVELSVEYYTRLIGV